MGLLNKLKHLARKNISTVFYNQTCFIIISIPLIYIRFKYTHQKNLTYSLWALFFSVYIITKFYHKRISTIPSTFHIHPISNIINNYYRQVSLANKNPFIKTLTLSQCKSENLCPICLEDFKLGSTTAQTTCHHEFHENCIGKWLTISSLCPICKQTIT